MTRKWGVLAGIVALSLTACGRVVLPAGGPLPAVPQVRQATTQPTLIGVSADIRRLLERQFAKDPDYQFIDRVKAIPTATQGFYAFECRFTDNVAIPRRVWKLSGTYDSVTRKVAVTHQEPIPDPILP